MRLDPWPSAPGRAHTFRGQPVYVGPSMRGPHGDDAWDGPAVMRSDALSGLMAAA